MTENLKKYLELISNDEKAKNELTEFEKEAVKENPETALQRVKEKAITDAAKRGIILAEADFKNETNELCDDELDQAVGGKQCGCFMSGGGSATAPSEKSCSCVAIGFGDGIGFNVRCCCPLLGNGDSLK